MEKTAKKKSRKTGQPGENKNDETESEIDGTNLGKHITYDVLRMMFEYFNIKTLTRAGMVCRSWNEAALKEMKTRIKPQRVVCEFNPEKKKYPDLKSLSDELFIRPKLGLIFVGGLAELKNIWCHPSCRTPVCLCSRLPPDAEYITLSNYGLVSDNLELEGDVITSIFLPEIPDVKIKSFFINTKDIYNLRSMTRRRHLNRLAAKKICKISPNEENLKCLIMFKNQEDCYLDPLEGDIRRILELILSERSNDDENKITVWGGFADSLKGCGSMFDKRVCNKKCVIAGISICGTGVSTWSIILDRGVKTRSQVEKKLTTLKNTVKLRKYSLGFMFACCGRGEQWYSEKNVESGIFRKLFPNVPLVGSFGGGELGNSTVPQESSKGSTIAHEYSTVFLILSYGPMRKTL